MKIEIKNCNNIESGDVSIVENSLNIKYAINGTGKSTIARSIVAAIHDRELKQNTLGELTPFKYVGKNIFPSVVGTEAIKTVKVFDEKYINEFVFQPDELIRGSFDIFIRDSAYDEGMAEINRFVDTIHEMLSNDVDTTDLIKDFEEISASFGKSVKTGIHGSSIIAKSFKAGNKISHIPPGLELFAKYIQHETNYKWIKWQIDGKLFSDMSADCPYCVTDIQEKKATISKVGEVYESKAIESLNKIVAAFERLKKYFCEDAKKKIDDFVKNVDGYNEEQTAYLLEIKDQIDRLKEKFLAARALGFTSLKDVDVLIEALNAHRIDLDLYVHLNSEETRNKVAIVNAAIDELVSKAGSLQGSINKQKRTIERLIKESSAGINSFLRNAGYLYQVSLVEDAKGHHRLKLTHKDIGEEITNVRSHLSFGERNAFALVLFMYDVLKQGPDLIILDDPISSFDKNKKYALMEMLFRKGSSFRGKTTLLLTHDFEPIVDMTYHHPDRFSKPYSTFLENVHGRVQEKEILRSDIGTFIEINKKNISSEMADINKVVYLRRLYEVLNQKGAPYHLLSSLLHKRPVPLFIEAEDVRELTAEEIQRASTAVREEIPDFDYEKLLIQVTDNETMRSLYLNSPSNFEKLHIYRIMFDGEVKVDSDIIKKFINEAFHVENNYIYQLNPRAYQLVPQYVIDVCDEFVSSKG